MSDPNLFLVMNPDDESAASVSKWLTDHGYNPLEKLSRADDKHDDADETEVCDTYTSFYSGFHTTVHEFIVFLNALPWKDPISVVLIIKLGGALQFTFRPPGV